MDTRSALNRSTSLSFAYRRIFGDWRIRPFSQARTLGMFRTPGVETVPVNGDPFDVWDPDVLHRMHADMLSGRFPVRASIPDVGQCVCWSAEENDAFRAWHDLQHVRYNLGFSPEEELILATSVACASLDLDLRFIHWIEVTCSVRGFLSIGEFPEQTTDTDPGKERVFRAMFQATFPP
jgi:hypothetical protein